jgi:hypothetical protein
MNGFSFPVFAASSFRHSNIRISDLTCPGAPGFVPDGSGFRFAQHSSFEFPRRDIIDIDDIIDITKIGPPSYLIYPYYYGL